MVKLGFQLSKLSLSLEKSNKIRNQDIRDLEKLRTEVQRRLEEEKKLPLKVSIMGQTGVGKSSLLNSLFNTKLKTDPVRPCTKAIERIVIQGNSGQELWFYDLPGIGEADKADIQYLTKYKQMLDESDIVLWAIHADNRSISFDLDALRKILETFDRTQQARLMSRITFVLTKADVLTPPPWILTKVGSNAIFVPHPETRSILEQKELYYQESFILPFKDRLTSQTYHTGDFDISIPPLLTYDENTVYYRSFLDKKTATELKKRFPKGSDVFDRLHDNYRVIICSSLFKFNLTLLMRVIIDKLGAEAVAQFSNFHTNSRLDIIPLSEAKRYCNMVILDEAKGQVIFNLENTKI